MTRVLLVCPEPLGHGQPAGVGVRFIEMAGVLLADGHAVTVLSADGGAVAGCRTGNLEPESMRDSSVVADVAVVQGHAANAFFAHGRVIPTVIDLYDPFIIENLHYYATRGAEVYTHDHATLIRSLMRGDVFLCASAAQRLFYLGLLLAVGRLNPVAFDTDSHLGGLLRLAPFGVQPARPARSRPTNAILFGGIYDWYDPITAIDAAAIARKSIPDITLTFTRHPNPDSTPQGKAAEAMEHVRRWGHDQFIRFEPWVPYEQRGEFFERHALAMLCFPQSIETDLSMRTRVYDYLWGGLPVITSPAPGTDEILLRYSTGAVVRAGSAETFAAAIVSILSDRDRLQEMSQGTTRFVRDHQWPLVLEPLREFCRNPAFEKSKEAFAVELETPARTESILDRLRRRIGGAS